MPMPWSLFDLQRTFGILSYKSKGYTRHWWVAIPSLFEHDVPVCVQGFPFPTWPEQSVRTLETTALYYRYDQGANITVLGFLTPEQRARHPLSWWLRPNQPLVELRATTSRLARATMLLAEGEDFTLSPLDALPEAQVAEARLPMLYLGNVRHRLARLRLTHARMSTILHTSTEGGETLLVARNPEAPLPRAAYASFLDALKANLALPLRGYSLQQIEEVTHGHA